MAQKRKDERTNVPKEKFTKKALNSSKPSTKAKTSSKSDLDYDDNDTYDVLKSKLNPFEKMTGKDKSLWKQLFRFVKPVLYCIGLVIFVLIIRWIVLKPSNSEIAQQENDIKKLHETLDLLANETNGDVIDQQKTEEYNDQIYNGSIDSNEAVIDDFFKKFLNWQSGEQYQILRSEIQNYLATADGQPMYTDRNSFVQCFLPPQDETYDEQKHKVYEIDAENTKLEYKGMQLYRLENTPNATTYAAIVYIHITSTYTDYMGSDRAVYVTFTLKNGKLHNLNASPIYQGIQ